MQKDSVKHSDIGFHGRNAAGYYVFSCYARGLGQYVTNASTRHDARADAKHYFNQLARKG